MKRLIALLGLTALLALPALALAKIPARGSTRSAIIKVAVNPSRSQGGCWDAYLASKGSPWGIVSAPDSDQHKAACREVQPGDFSILHFANRHWHVVSGGDEVMCPFQSNPHEPTIPGKILKELTGTYCNQ